MNNFMTVYLGAGMKCTNYMKGHKLPKLTLKEIDKNLTKKSSSR